MTDAEQWAAFLATAQAKKAVYGDAANPNGVAGRSITLLVNKLVEFWGTHQDTLIPFFSSLAIAALEALVAQRANINTVNGRGPR